MAAPNPTAAPSNGNHEDAARRVVFATADPEPAKPPELPRLPREGEGLGDYVTAVAKNIGVLPQTASLTARRKREVAEELLDRANADELFGGSRAGRAILTAERAWQQANPAIASELGSLGASSRDMAGRSVRGPARACALVLEHLTEDPSRTLSAAEEELLRHLAPAVAKARQEAAQTRREQAESVLAAVNAAQLDYPAGQPGAAIVREES